MITGSLAETAVSDPARLVLHTSSVTPLVKLTVPTIIAPCASKEPPASTVTVPTWTQPAGMRTDSPFVTTIEPTWSQTVVEPVRSGPADVNL